MKNSEKHLIVVSNDRSKFAEEIVGSGLIPTYCPPQQTALYGMKDRADCILILLYEEKEEDIKRLARYLTNLCIDEEKNLFVFGKKNLVDIIKKAVPSLFVISSGYAFSDVFTDIIKDLLLFMNEMQERNKPALLFVDVDDSYITRIRPYLTKTFDVYSSINGNGYDISSRVRFSDVVVLSTSVTLPAVAFTTLFVSIMKKRLKDPDFAVYFMASNSDEQNIINTLSVNYDGQSVKNVLEEGGFISISKDKDLEKTADFLIKRVKR